ncbi:hypothetical protein MMC11_007208 [Xylographa trunciseda]|nr:hypothetical protein [Xylographa trunciseda]
MAHTPQCLYSLRKHKVLSPEALSALRARGHTAVLLGPYLHLPNSCYMPPGTIFRPTEVLIPYTLHSLETLEFLELDAPTATAIWARFCAPLPTPTPTTPTTAPAATPSLIALVRAHLAAFDAGAVERSADWGRGMGLALEGTLRMQHAGWRAGGAHGGLKAWVCAMVEMRWRFLVLLDGVLRTGERAVLRGLHPAALMVGIR